jgi:hypothetical protein
MRNLFALLVAINNYAQSGIRDLDGCLNDLEDINLFLEAHCKRTKNVELHRKILKNEEATRQAVINGFKLFEDAQNGDVCLFYFSGHGSQIDAPKEFWNESDAKLEAIVCHVEKGNDNLLVDKELSFLIANVQKDKEVHFIVITDSCHSGSNTKDSSFSVRSVPSNINSRETDTYLGREYFNEIKNDNGEIVRLSPPIGKHVKLSACTNSEVAKEKSLGIDSKVRGIFTYSIFEVLKSNGYNLSYLNLASKVRIKTLSLTKDQSPQLETIALHPQEHNRIFLNGLLEEEQPRFQVNHNEKENRWEINVGSIYGIHEKDIAVLFDDDEQVEITAVKTTFSILDFEPLKFHPRDKIFDAAVIPKLRRKLKIGFSTNNRHGSSNILLEFLEKSPVIELDNGNDINYIIRVADDTLALTHPESYIPIFSRIRGQREPQARLFIKIVEQIAEWHHIVYISNPNSKIEDSEVEIKFSAVEKPYIAPLNLIDSVSSILIEDWQEDNIFRYHFYEEHPKGPWHTPAFRLSLINTSKKRKLWVSVLYCGTGYTVDGTGMNYSSTSFSITNRFLEKEELSIGGIAKLTDELNDVELESIILSLLDDYFDQGYNEIKDTIKIFLSTEEIDTSPFNMVGVPIDVEEVMAPRPAGTLRPSEVQQSDWRTFEIPVTIVRPRDEGTLNIRQSKSLYGLTIGGHPTFSARIILSTMEEFIRSTKVIVDGHKKYMPRPEILYGNETVCPVKFTNGLGDVEGCSVIEFYRSEGTKSINEEQPLVFCIDIKISPLTDEHKLILVGYSSDKRAYFSLGIMNENREIKINGLPFESPSVIDGLGNSIKLILLKVRLEFEIPSFLSTSKSL